MSRPTKAKVDYFPHDCTHGKTLFILQQKYKNDGYAVWFKLLEQLGRAENHFIDCRNDDTWLYLQSYMLLNEVTLNDILNLCAKMNTINKQLWENYRIIFSENLVDRLKGVYERRIIEIPKIQTIIKLAGVSVNINGVNATETPLNGVSANINPQSKVKESKVKKSINTYHKYNKYIIYWNGICKTTPLKSKNSMSNQIIVHIKNREKENPEFYQLFKNAIEKIKISPNLQKQKWLNFEFMFLVQKSQSGVDKINDGKYDFLEEDEKKPLKTMSEYERGQINKSIKVLTEMGFDNSDAKRLSMIYKNYEIVKLNIEGACNEDQGDKGQFFLGNIRYAIEINKYGKELKK